jgi:hypothetical protein
MAAVLDDVSFQNTASHDLRIFKVSQTGKQQTSVVQYKRSGLHGGYQKVRSAWGLPKGQVCMGATKRSGLHGSYQC